MWLRWSRIPTSMYYYISEYTLHVSDQVWKLPRFCPKAESLSIVSALFSRVAANLTLGRPGTWQWPSLPLPPYLCVPTHDIHFSYSPNLLTHVSWTVILPLVNTGGHTSSCWEIPLRSLLEDKRYQVSLLHRDPGGPTVGADCGALCGWPVGGQRGEASAVYRCPQPHREQRRHCAGGPHWWRLWVSGWLRDGFGVVVEWEEVRDSSCTSFHPSAICWLMAECEERNFHCPRCRCLAFWEVDVLCKFLTDSSLPGCSLEISVIWRDSYSGGLPCCVSCLAEVWPADLLCEPETETDEFGRRSSVLLKLEDLKLYSPEFWEIIW